MINSLELYRYLKTVYDDTALFLNECSDCYSYEQVFCKTKYQCKYQ